MKAKSLLVSACGVAALALAVGGGLLGWREWHERTLLRDLESPERASREAAALELGRLESTRAIPMLLGLLKGEAYMEVSNHPPADPDELLGDTSYHFPAAVRALADIGVPAVPALVEALSKDDENPLFQIQIILVFRLLGPDARAAVPTLTKALDSSNVWVLIHASLALRSMGERAAGALPALEARASKDPMGRFFRRIIDDIAAGANHPPP